jgi:hypothetical protein
MPAIPGDSDLDAEPEREVTIFSFRENPISSTILAVCVIAGAIAGFYGFDDSLGSVRALLGGALVGAGSWLLVMVGRVIG